MAQNEVSEKLRESINQLIERSDELCSAVISGKSGQMQMALAVARALSELQRSGYIKNRG